MTWQAGDEAAYLDCETPRNCVLVEPADSIYADDRWLVTHPDDDMADTAIIGRDLHARGELEAAAELDIEHE